jgi:hypothetical protein
MMTDISSFFQLGWKNLWKEKLLWLFSGLVLIDPLLRFLIPTQTSNNFLLSLLNLVVSFVFLVVTFISYTGTTYVAYSIAAGNPVSIQETFQVAKKFFWRTFSSTCLFSLFFILFFVLCFLSIFIFYFKRSPQSSDFSYFFFFISMFFSIFAAPWYFLLAEIVVNDSKIGKSMENAWNLFIENFAVLAVIGIILSIMLYAINVTLGVTTLLIQNDFDFSALSKFNFIAPQLFFLNNNLYRLESTITYILRHIYSISIFMVAFLKYGSLKNDKNNILEVNTT